MWRRYENETHIVYETIYYVYYASVSTKTRSLMMPSGIEARVVLNRVEPSTGVLSTMRITLGNETLSVNERGVVIYTKRVDRTLAPTSITSLYTYRIMCQCAAS